MSGLPRMPRLSRNRSPWAIFVLGGVERLTRDLMGGEDFDEDGLRDMQALRMRLTAFSNALDAREKAHGIVVEDTE